MSREIVPLRDYLSLNTPIDSIFGEFAFEPEGKFNAIKLHKEQSAQQDRLLRGVRDFLDQWFDGIEQPGFNLRVDDELINIINTTQFTKTTAQYPSADRVHKRGDIYYVVNLNTAKRNLYREQDVLSDMEIRCGEKLKSDTEILLVSDRSVDTSLNYVIERRLYVAIAENDLMFGKLSQSTIEQANGERVENLSIFYIIEPFSYGVVIKALHRNNSKNS